MRVLLAVVLLCTGAARAEEPAWAAYVQGDFLEAASLAEPRDGALAARALIAEAVTGAQGDIDALIARANRTPAPHLPEAAMQMRGFSWPSRLASRAVARRCARRSAAATRARAGR